MLNDLLSTASAGKPLFITDVRTAFSALPSPNRRTLTCDLRLVRNSEVRRFEIPLPAPAGLSPDGLSFVKTYLRAEIYNILTNLGGIDCTVYVDHSDTALCALAQELAQVFQTGQKRSQRNGYGRVINVIDRMLGALLKSAVDGEPPAFRFIVKDLAHMPLATQVWAEKPGDSSVFTDVTQGLQGKSFCGIDIGGTDIKFVVVQDGHILCFKEFDWFPDRFKVAAEMIDPVCLLMKLMQCAASLPHTRGISAPQSIALNNALEKGLDREASLDQVAQSVELITRALGGVLTLFDGIGLSFPDVVVKDKIVGGEVTKTRGMRENAAADYEAEFAKLTDLDIVLKGFCTKTGTVKVTNDGPMAAFTAAVELAASLGSTAVADGVFAHTLGTELGTGWVRDGGAIPEIPLESYNKIIDLGDFVAKGYPAADVRSIVNFNTGLAGTLQRYTSQSGIFRLAQSCFAVKRPDLYRELFDKGFIVERDIAGERLLVVPTEPKDMRKGLLEHLMSLPEREKDDVAAEIFRQVGEFLAVTWLETERICAPRSKARVFFGRIVKNPHCFRLICEGAQRRVPGITFTVADADLAHTPLMRELKTDTRYTVAQFAQAVGAVYFANQR